MKENKQYPIEFYGGHFGALLCVVMAMAGILYTSLFSKGGARGIILVVFLSLVFGLLIAKDRKAYGDELLKGLKESMLCTVGVAFLMAGMLSALLKSSGLIQALIWFVSEMNVHVGLLPLVAFLVCVLISTACGTSTGTVTAVSAVLCPLAGELGVDMGMMCGAIISGSIFGDNLAPISDTTIASSQTQGASLRDVVRTRLPYSLIVGAISAVLYAVVGLRGASTGIAHFVADPSTAKSLVLLILPILLVVLMRRGWGLVSSLLLSNALAILLCLVLGAVPPAKMFSNSSPIVTGMTGMANLVIIAFLMIMLLNVPNKSGAFEAFAQWLMKRCSTIRGAELITYAMAFFGCIATHASTSTIMFFGPFAHEIMGYYGDQADPCRSANILDAVACGTNGLIPHGNPALVIMGVATAVKGVDASFSFMNFLPYNYHCWGLLIIFLLSIITGIGRKRNRSKDEPAEV